MVFLSFQRIINSSFAFFKQTAISSLNIQQRKVISVVLPIFALITSGFLAYRYLFSTKSLSKEHEKQPPLHKVSKLVLHIDVNRTIIADDPNVGFQLPDILAMLLAETATCRWDPLNHQESSFQDYVSKLIPGSHNGSIKKQRQAILKDFIHLLEHSSFQDESSIDFTKLKEHPQQDIAQVKQKISQAKQQVIADLNQFKQSHKHEFEQLKQQVLQEYRIMEEKLKQHEHGIFPSFFRLIEWLREKQEIDFHLVFRTFGNDAQRVIVEIEKRFPEERFTHRGQYLNGQWHITTINENDKSALHKKAKEIYHYFQSSTCRHLALRDDWTEWNAHQEHQDHGKRFPVELNSMDIHAIFIDDNVEESSQTGKNIVTVVDMHTDQPIPIDAFIAKKIVVRAKPKEAILKDDYFICVVEESLKLNGKTLGR